ncbi:hypothetical protein C8Q77DRAFT_227372 [Trametes polyzona]|nr:hypothetical protein C8Q77DRAFT_227372 [Trametes polyzona]
MGPLVTHADRDVTGVYTTVFFMTLYSIYKKRREGVNKFTTITLVLLYALATGHVCLALARLIQGFILYRDRISPLKYFADDSVRLNMAKDYLYITTLFLGDLIIVWRLYVVWGRNLYIAILPMLMCLGELGVGYASISQWLAPHQNFKVMDDLGTAMFALSLPTNIILTIVTAARICYYSKAAKSTLAFNHPTSVDATSQVGTRTVFTTNARSCSGFSCRSGKSFSSSDTSSCSRLPPLMPT